jgi:hypothetical protein
MTMLLHSRNNNTLRLLKRLTGSEIRFNHKVFFANDDLTDIIRFVINTSNIDNLPLYSSQPAPDENIVRDTLHKLSEAGIPLSFWGEVWSAPEDSTVNWNYKKDEL